MVTSLAILPSAETLLFPLRRSPSSVLPDLTTLAHLLDVRRRNRQVSSTVEITADETGSEQLAQRSEKPRIAEESHVQPSFDQIAGSSSSRQPGRPLSASRQILCTGETLPQCSASTAFPSSFLSLSVHPSPVQSEEAIPQNTGKCCFCAGKTRRWPSSIGSTPTLSNPTAHAVLYLHHHCCCLPRNRRHSSGDVGTVRYIEGALIKGPK